jgi:hypothetical protein
VKRVAELRQPAKELRMVRKLKCWQAEPEERNVLKCCYG